MAKNTAQQVSEEIAGSGGYVINVNLPSWYKEETPKKQRFWDESNNRLITIAGGILILIILGIFLVRK